MRWAACALLSVVVSTPAAASSYYTSRPDDPRAVYLTRERFGAVGDGTADDSDAIQKAIDAVQESTGEGIVFVPEGRYRISRTLYVWPSIRVIGYGANRPAFVLGPRTPGFDDPDHERQLVFFAGRRPAPGAVPDDANPGTFYSALSNVDLEIQDGNAGAVGVRAKYAQHCFTSHVEFRIGSGLAGVHEGGNVAEDVRFVGGEYGIWTGTPSPGWQYTLVDASFEGQRRAAIREHEAGLTLIRPHFTKVPTAIEIEDGSPDELWVKDARLDDVSGPAFVISFEGNPRTEINMEGIVCRRVPVFAAFRESGRRLAAPGELYAVSAFTHGLGYSDIDAPGKTMDVFDARRLEAWPESVPSDLVPLPDATTWVNVRALGAKGDGSTDDTEAFRNAIAANRAIYVPSGKYIVTDTLMLKPDTVLIGLHPSATQLVIPDRTPAFQGSGPPRPLLDTPKGGTNVVIGIGLYTNGINARAVAARWRAGTHSMMNDVRFLGGHGTNGLDGKRENPYNSTHSGDPDPARRWDSQYPSLWVTDDGGGTFFDLWTPSTFAQAGMMISDTSTSGRVYQMSSEHHVRYEVQIKRAANWAIYALQTEGERGESGFSSALEIDGSRNITVANMHMYRVISSNQPFPYAIRVADSDDIRFRNIHSYSNSKVAYDATVFDSARGLELRQREFAWLTIRDTTRSRPHLTPGVTQPAVAHVLKLADGFHNIAGGAVAPSGDFYFVDAKWNRIYRWSVQRRVLTTIADAPLEPVNLAFDKAGNLLVVSYAGKGTVYSIDATGAGEMRLLSAEAARPRPGMTAILPSGDWRIQRDAGGQLLPRTHQFVSPDGTAYISATQGFVDGITSWGVKSSDLIRTFGLTRARPGQRIYFTAEAQMQTWSALVGDDGSLGDVRLFVNQGGEGVTTDSEGRVYLAAGDVYIYRPDGTLLRTIKVPERPLQVVFGGPDGRTLFMPARHGLYAVHVQ